MYNELKAFVKLMPLFVLASFGNDLPITALLNPGGLNAGGATGVATVLCSMTHLQLMTTYGIVNLPILILSLRFLNLRYSIYSVFVTILTTLLFPYLAPFTLSNLNSFASIVIAGVVYGVSIGVTYRFNFSLGGFALLAKVLEVITNRQVGTLFTLINFVPVFLAYLLNSSLSTLLESFIFIYLTGIVINWVTMGRSYLKHCRETIQNVLILPTKLVRTSSKNLKTP